MPLILIINRIIIPYIQSILKTDQQQQQKKPTTQTTNSIKMPRNLILHEQQSYQGARSFYYCFIPTAMAFVIIFRLYLEGPILYLLLWDAGVVVSYAVSAWYYRRCNQIHVGLKAQGQSDLDVDGVGVGQALGISNAETQNIKNNNSNSQAVTLSSSSFPQKPPVHSCSPCKLTLPYRSRHCPKCSICIFRYDHHCFWIGNCVGYHNHRQFYCFLCFQTVNNVYMVLGLIGLYSSLASIERYWVWYWIVCGLAICAIGFVGFTGWLWFYHTMLMLTGMTTWEHLARSKITYLKYLPSGYNPFSKGVIQNIKQFWHHKQQEQLIEQYEKLLPTFAEAQFLKPGCSLIQNQYYSCC